MSIGLDFRDERGSGLDWTGSGLKPILAGSGLDRTYKNFCCFDVIILTAAKISVVMRFCRFDER